LHVLVYLYLKIAVTPIFISRSSAFLALRTITVTEILRSKGFSEIHFEYKVVKDGNGN